MVYDRTRTEPATASPWFKQIVSIVVQNVCNFLCASFDDVAEATNPNAHDEQQDEKKKLTHLAQTKEMLIDALYYELK